MTDQPHWAADLFLRRDRRDKKRSASIFAAATVLWILFECMEYHFLAFVCHLLILSLAIMFFWSNSAWSNSAAFLKRSLRGRIAINEVELDDLDYLYNLESDLRYHLQNSFADPLQAAFVTYTKISLLVVAVSCLPAVIGSCCSCLPAVIGCCCRCLLTIFSFIMISFLRQAAVNIMASEFYGAFADLREAVTGTDKNKFVLGVLVIWVIGFIGSCSSFLLTIFSVVIISSVVLIKRSLHQKIVSIEDEVHDSFSEVRRHLQNLFSVRVAFDTTTPSETYLLNTLADRFRAAFVTYMKTSVLVVASLWLLFVIGSWRDFLTLALMLVVTHTVPFLLYEEYQD